jgi:hypothetical protein
VLLDFGLAEELTPDVRRQFISFLHMISAGVCALLAAPRFKSLPQCGLSMRRISVPPPHRGDVIGRWTAFLLSWSLPDRCMALLYAFVIQQLHPVRRAGVCLGWVQALGQRHFFCMPNRTVCIPFVVGNGRRAAEHLLQMGSNAECPDVLAFTHDMVQLFDRWVGVIPSLHCSSLHSRSVLCPVCPLQIVHTPTTIPLEKEGAALLFCPRGNTRPLLSLLVLNIRLHSWKSKHTECLFPNPSLPYHHLCITLTFELLAGRDCNVHRPEGIDVDFVLKEVLQLARKHEVSIDSSYAALVVGVCVLVGFATGNALRLPSLRFTDFLWCGL